MLRSVAAIEGTHRLPIFMTSRLALLVAPLVLALTPSAGDELAYRLREVEIPMRDGVHLHTKIFEPVGAPAPVPILLNRTPYGIADVAPGGSIGPSRVAERAGYVFVHQDVRGQFGSEGEWEVMRPARDARDPDATDERTDTWDTLEWLLAHVEGHNGKVGMWGISYPGWQVAMAMSEAHPALLAVSPQASPGDMFTGDDLHHNGAFRLSYSFAWAAFMSVRSGDLDRNEFGKILGQDGYAFFRGKGSAAAIGARYFGKTIPGWSEVLVHPDHGEFWERRNVVALLDEVGPAALHVAGWYDAEDFRGPLEIYARSERADQARHNFLVVGPWKHGGWSGSDGEGGAKLGELSFGAPTATWFQEQVELPFFEHYLRGAEAAAFPEVRAFETGANAWRTFDAWPPRASEPRALHLHADGVLSFESAGDDEGAAEFVSDPTDPVPYSAGTPVFPGPLYMIEDQRFLDARSDVLTFVSEPLEEDLVLAGAPDVRFAVATTGTDADWVVKLIEVWPEDAADPALAGDWRLVTGDIFRARYRTGFATPAALEPGQVTELHFPLPDRLHRFRAGHCLALQIHSTWFPLYDVNPQTFTDIYHAKPADYRPATQRVFHGREGRSLVELPVLAD